MTMSLEKSCDRTPKDVAVMVATLAASKDGGPRLEHVTTTVADYADRLRNTAYESDGCIVKVQVCAGKRAVEATCLKPDCPVAESQRTALVQIDEKPLC